VLRNVDCIALRTESDGILAANPEPPSVLSLNFGGRKRCTLKPCVDMGDMVGVDTCVNIGDRGLDVKTVVERVSVNMGDNNIIVKTVVERVSVNMGDNNIFVKTVVEKGFVNTEKGEGHVRIVYEPKTISIMI
jgi:hypothetical protein